MSTLKDTAYAIKLFWEAIEDCDKFYTGTLESYLIMTSSKTKTSFYLNHEGYPTLNIATYPSSCVEKYFEECLYVGEYNGSIQITKEEIIEKLKKWK